MIKYDLIAEQLLREGIIQQENFFKPQKISDTILQLTHDLDYINKLKTQNLSNSEIRKIGFPLSESLVEREYVITEGTLQCTLKALEHGFSANIAGGTHHAYSNSGEGFCIFNDFAVAANYLLHHQLRNRILIIDLDVHQGNGTARIFQDQPKVFTFSMHGKNNYPLHKEKSDLDIELEDGCNTCEYLDLLKTHLPNVIKQFKPDFVFYLSGVDIIESDKLGRLAVSVEGCKQRDILVLTACHQLGIPVCMAMGGGYSPDIKIITNAHCNSFAIAKDLWF